VETTTPSEKTRTSVFKKTVKFFFYFFLIVILGIFSLLGLLFVYQDEVKAAIVSELNKYLKAEVKIDPANIDLTIIKTFPDCSIQFTDLLMLEALPVKNRDTLLYAGTLNLHFNIRDLWNKNYEIKKIRLKDAVVKLKVLKNGKENYIFWKAVKKTNTGRSDSLRFNLKLITLENCRLSYKNKKTLFKTEISVQKLDLKGFFHESDYELQSDARFLIHEIVQGKTTFLKGKRCSFSVDMDVSDNEYTFKKTTVNLNELALKLEGRFNYTDSLESLEIKYNAPDLDIASVLSLLPEKYKDKINDYESSGNFYAGGTIRYLNKQSFSVISDFGVKTAQITYKPKSTVVTNVNLEGHLNYSNAGSMLGLKNVHLQLNSDEIKGNCFIKDFSEPYLQFSVEAALNLENLQNFWPIDTLTQLKGQLKIRADAEGSLKNLKEETFSTKVGINLDAHVSDLEAKFKGDDKIYAVENCSIAARDREIEVRELKLKRGHSDMTLNGKIPGVFNYLLDRTSPLVITGSLYSNYLEMEDFMVEANSKDVNENPVIPVNIQFKLNAAILKFSFGKFNAQALTGEVEVKNQKAVISDMKLQTMQGEAEIDAFADNSKGKLDIVLQSKLKNINITDLFSQLNNFRQTTLTDKNIKGLATATVEFSGSWNNRLEADPRAIVSVCNINIERGELIDFKPLLSLSKFVDVQDLKWIKFSSLQSRVEINNSLITIPRTSIRNSALNIEFWGTHSFNNEIDYHIRLLISDLLAKKRRNKDNEFGAVENDRENRRSAFLLMTGNIDNPVIKYDRQGLKEKIKADIKEEKQNIRHLLKEEFGLFKKDSLSRKNKNNESVFELEKPEKEAPKKALEPKKKKEEDDDF
jgi:hypothetical protein